MTKAKNSREMEKIDIATDVMVIGGGYTGLKAAASIAETGYNVLLADQEESANLSQYSLAGISSDHKDKLDSLKNEVQQNSRIELLPGANIKQATGVPGDFTIRLTSNQDYMEKKVGAVVVATDIVSRPL